MIDHLSAERLAAVAAGDASDTEQTHVTTCARCEEGVSAIRRATDDLRALALPISRAEDRAALRAALALERSDGVVTPIKPSRQPALRWLGAAASLVIVLAGVTAVLNDQRKDVRSPIASNMEARGLAPSGFTEESVRQMLLSFPAEDNMREADQQPAPHVTSNQAGASADAAAPRDCSAEIWKGRAVPPLAAFYEGTWESKPAQVFVYRIEGSSPHLEAWVVQPDDCTILHFASQRTR